jgi:hypothetical protein
MQADAPANRARALAGARECVALRARCPEGVFFAAPAVRDNIGASRPHTLEHIDEASDRAVAGSSALLHVGGARCGAHGRPRLVPTGILYDLTAQIAHVERFDGTASAPAASSAVLRQAAFELRQASIEAGALFPSQDKFRDDGSLTVRIGLIVRSITVSPTPPNNPEPLAWRTGSWCSSRVLWKRGAHSSRRRFATIRTAAAT